VLFDELHQGKGIDGEARLVQRDPNKGSQRQKGGGSERTYSVEWRVGGEKT